VPNRSHQPAFAADDDDDEWVGERKYLRLGWLWGIFLRRPKDSVVALVAAIAVLAICVNGLFLQPGPHPAPIFPVKPLPVASADATGALASAPAKLRPVAADAAQPDAAVPARPRADVVADIQRELARRAFYDGGVDGVYGAKTDAAIRDFEQAAGRKASIDPNEALLQAIKSSTLKARPVSVPHGPPRNDPIAELIAPSRQVLAVQRALSEFGYGQIKPTGLFDQDTKLAIERFERERRLPVTGDISERVARELTARTGRPLE
jgi:peptidoglycan hydrolase-like protein with peptidoglycan-binding domain